MTDGAGDACRQCAAGGVPLVAAFVALVALTSGELLVVGLGGRSARRASPRWRAC